MKFIATITIVLAFVGFVHSRIGKSGGNFEKVIDIQGVGAYNSEEYKQNITLVSATASSFCECRCFNAPAPTPAPTSAPSHFPSAIPTALPTEIPTPVPTTTPTATPTEAPTEVPTAVPSAVPTEAPTEVPTAVPSAVPTEAPTEVPTAVPSAVPTEAPTEVPTTEPTASPTELPTAVPSTSPSVKPSTEPTVIPSAAPTVDPTASPTAGPSAVPSANPSTVPSITPSALPTAKPTASPTTVPTATPTANPTRAPTANPTANPSLNPTTSNPTVAPTSSGGGAFTGSICATGNQYLRATLAATIGSGDFTIEFWFNPQNTNSVQGITGFGPYSSGSTSNGRCTIFWCYPNLSGRMFFQDATYPSSFVQYTNVISTGVWHHLAVVRSSGVVKQYVDGVSNGVTTSFPSNFNNNQFTLFRDYYDISQEYFNGCISGFAVSKVALYTSTFTPSRNQIANDANKILILNVASSSSPFIDSSSYGNTLTNSGVTYSTSHP